MINHIIDLFSDNVFYVMFYGTLLIGFATGSIGVFTTLRKRALIGDALSHATLPGIVFAAFLLQTESLTVLLVGAAISALVSMLLMNLIENYTKIKIDASMALILSGFFGLGTILMAPLRVTGIDRFVFFGDPTLIFEQDVFLILGLTILTFLIVVSFWRHIKLFIFNREFYESLGFSSKFISGLLTFLTIIVVTISIKVIGVVLMSALLIVPAVIARLWSDKLFVNYITAGLIGLIGGGLGTYLSYVIEGLPTGPTIVVVLSILLILALLFSRKKGIVTSEIRRIKHRRLVNKYHILVHIYEYGDVPRENSNKLKQFLDDNYISENNNKYYLTNKGRIIVNNILRGDQL